MELEKNHDGCNGGVALLLAVCVHLVYQVSAEAETRNNCMEKQI